MMIYSMTATFGKLEHETLTLHPGLNIVQAPNEWGKSTWCAFLDAMLYGMETRAKTTKTALAGKEHYAPWSGSPMAGRMDISWQGRDITIERSTRGRVPLGVFRAYETASGLPVPELTAANCGETLLGVERSVFLRAGFIRLSDLPVTDDEALRRRLNALVTTGDESAAANRLGRGLKELKNRVRYNRSGLLPQAEAERNALEGKRRELEELQTQTERTKERLTQLEQWRVQLENHQAALIFAAAQQDLVQVKQAEQARDAAAQTQAEMAEKCAAHPQRDAAQQTLGEIRRLEQQRQNLQMDLQLLPMDEAEPLEPKAAFRGMEGDAAVAMAKSDGQRYQEAKKQKGLWLILGVLLGLLGIAAALWYPLPGAVCAAGGAALLAWALVQGNRRRQAARQLEERYGSQDSSQWVQAAEDYAAQLSARAEAAAQKRRERQEIMDLLAQTEEKIASATQGRGLEKCRADWEAVLADWDAYTDACRQHQQAEKHYQALRAMARPAPAPAMPDAMTHSEADTARLLSDCFGERQRLENRLGQYQGRMEALGDFQTLEAQTAAVNRRIARLEQTYAALEAAQETLAAAAEELQRRFAPRIAQRAQALMAQMTGGCYDRLSLGRDLSIQAGGGQEDTLRGIIWRSDGTIDQLYLALRLAVAGELTENAPLVLDDALVRFDDSRLAAALDILQQTAKERQVILFTCQKREQAILEKQA